MTVVVAFFCSDGVVIGADSMLTPSMGGTPIGHHHGQKISILQGPQLYAFAGDLGQSERVKIMCDGSYQLLAQAIHPIDFPLAITQGMIQQFQNTGILNNINCSPIVAFEHAGNFHCCVFEGALQPRLLDADHYFVALGSGKLSADPFLRFLTDTFCANGQPTIAEAVFLTAWTIQHVIEVNPGGVAAPIRIATLHRSGGQTIAEKLHNQDIDEHLQAVESAGAALRMWRDDLQSGSAADDAPAQPVAPKN